MMQKPIPLGATDNAPVQAPPAPPHPWRAYGCLALSMALVGSYVGLSPLLVAVFPVLLLAWLRFAVAALAMGTWLRRAPTEKRLNRREHGLLFLQSLLGNFLFTLCALHGTWLAGALSAGIIMAGIPAFVALLSSLFLGERISARIWWAVTCSVGAVALLAWVRAGGGHNAVSAQVQASSEALWGHLLLIAAVVCEAAYVVIGKRLSAQVSSRRVSAIINLWGLVFTTPMGIALSLHFDFAAVPAGIWGLLAFYALTASVVTVWLWMKGLQHVPAQQAGVFSVFLPLSSAAVGVLILDEPWALLHGMALLLALLAVLLVTSARPSAAPAAPV